MKNEKSIQMKERIKKKIKSYKIIDFLAIPHHLLCLMF